MARTSLLAFVAALATFTGAWVPVLATSIEVPVDGLNGYYGPDTTRAAGTYTVSFDPGEILSARVLIFGNLVWPSYYSCQGQGGTFVNGSYFFAGMSTTSGEWYTDTTYVDRRVSFVAYLDWRPSNGATWEFLSGGSGSFVLSGFARLLPDGCQYQHGSSDTTAEIFDARIIFELRDPNPVEQSTWGRIKSLFLTN